MMTLSDGLTWCALSEIKFEFRIEPTLTTGGIIVIIATKDDSHIMHKASLEQYQARPDLHLFEAIQRLKAYVES
jgi:hypothetical protein